MGAAATRQAARPAARPARGITCVCISDTHGLHEELDPLTAGDVLIHAGDFTRYGKVQDFISFKLWLERVRHNYGHVVVVNGNHESNAPWRRHTRTVLELPWPGPPHAPHRGGESGESGDERNEVRDDDLRARLEVLLGLRG